jgi:hypothetical protein
MVRFALYFVFAVYNVYNNLVSIFYFINSILYMPHQKSSDYKETAVQYYLVEDNSQEEVCRIFKCSRRSLMRWVDKI